MRNHSFRIRGLGKTVGSRPLNILLTAGLALALLVALASAVTPMGMASAELPAQGIARGKKLILKDGSYQMVRDWELLPDPSVKGHPESTGRIRYYSVERSRYEELPASLVDFAATRAAEKEQADRDAALQEEIAAGRIERLAGEIDVDSSIEVSPGLFLPDDQAGMWVLVPDNANPQRSLLLPLAQVGAESRVDKGRLITKIFVPIPIIPGKHRVELAGKQAILRLTDSSPEFYIRTEDKREPEVELIQVKVKGNKREVEVLETWFTGENREKRQAVSVQRWPVARGVFRLTMSQALAPGEYVLAEILPGEGMNLYVWDFGVDSPAPAKSVRR
jgi:hypothetical protein